MSETFKNPTPETLSGEKGPWMVTDMNLEKLGLKPIDWDLILELFSDLQIKFKKLNSSFKN